MATAVRSTTVAGFQAWWHLVTLSFQRQWWSLQSLIAVVLLMMLAIVVGLRSIWGWWSVGDFANAIIGGVYISFFLPIMCLCFGTNSIGGDWEERSLVWLLTRPLPRPAIYLGKFLATAPWTFGLTLGGMLLLGLLAGRPGLEAFWHFWPAVAWGTLAYLSLFVLMGAWFRRSTVIAVVYSFVVETLVGNLPGLVKRASIAFYSRCLMYDAGVPGVEPEKRDLFMPVEGTTAVQVLVLVTAVLLLLGMIVFSRREYNDLT